MVRYILLTTYKLLIVVQESEAEAFLKRLKGVLQQDKGIRELIAIAAGDILYDVIEQYELI